jgi:membrane protein DedA with SNARE-associated domain
MEAVIVLPGHIGYLALGFVVFGESAGVPLPGATTLIAAGILASSGQINIVAVCAIGIFATVAGANLGYGFIQRPYSCPKG